MIDLTPLEVRKKKGDFKRAMRGYDPALVDDFLDVVADRLEQLVRDNLSLMDRLTRQDAQVAEYRERERALTEALVTAQEMREEIRNQASREAELAKQASMQESERLRAAVQQEAASLRAAAQQEANELRGNALRDREREEEGMRRLRARQEQFLTTYRAFLERELGELAVITQTLNVIGATNASAAAPPTPVPPPATSSTLDVAQAMTSVHAPKIASPVVAADSPVDTMPAAPPVTDTLATTSAFDDIVAAAPAAGHAEPEPEMELPEPEMDLPPEAPPPSPLQSAPVPGTMPTAAPSGMATITLRDSLTSVPITMSLPADDPPLVVDLDEDVGVADTSVEAHFVADTELHEVYEFEPFEPEPVVPDSTDDEDIVSSAPPRAPATPAGRPVGPSLLDMDDDDDDDEETSLLLRNAAAAGYRLPDEDELLLDEPAAEEEPPEKTNQGWLPNLLEDDK